MESKNELSLGSLVCASPDQVSSELSDEVVVLSLTKGEYYGLNPVAAFVWSFIQIPRTIEAIRAALLDEFTGISVELCTEELLALLTELRELDLISVR